MLWLAIVVTFLLPAKSDPGALLVVDGPAPPLAEVIPGGPERIYLYGGPGSLEGAFEDANGATDWQGWTSIDLTQDPYPLWQVSTFNAGTLGDHGDGNQAMWCGADDPGFTTGPGYGPNWNAILEWRSGPLADPSVGQTVNLEFLFHHDTEPGYDRFAVEYNRAGTWIMTMQVDGTDAVGGLFTAPGVSYSSLATQSITYAGGDYPDGEIVLRLRFRSDSSGDDADGVYPTVAGAVQVDDIRVDWVDGIARESFTDFEGAGPFDWELPVAEFAGDFMKIRARLADRLNCVQNNSPQMTFIDDGTPPNNAPGQSTGGSADPTIDYGLPPWGYPWTGGLTRDSANPIRPDYRPVSPAIALDAPGPEDDGTGWRVHIGYEHYYAGYGVTPDLFLEVRTSRDGGATWSAWETVNNFVYFAPSIEGYYDEDFDVHSFVPAGATHVQARLFNYRITNLIPTPTRYAAPFIDNFSVYKVRTGDLPAVYSYNRVVSTFPRDQGFDLATQAGRDALDIPLDIPSLNDGPRDSIPVSVEAWDGANPTAAENVRMVWVLDRNPVFEDAIRTMPVGATDHPGASRRGWNQWRGSFASELVPVYNGVEYTLDPPDVDFVYPGDELRWYVESTSTDGVVSTEPPVLDGFESGAGYDLNFTVRAFPSVDQTGTTPPVLAIQFGSHFPPQDRTLELALESIGMRIGVDVDVMYLPARLRRSAMLSDPDKIGPSMAQAEGYETLLLFGPRLDLSFEEADALVPFVTAWQDLPGDRTVILFDYYSLRETSVGADFWSRLGIAGGTTSYRSDYLGTITPYVVPVEPQFSETVFYGGWCRESERYRTMLDSPRDLIPVPPAFTGHVYSPNPDGSGPTLSASIIHSWDDGGDTKTAITLPLYFTGLGKPVARDTGLLEEARLLHDLLEYSGVPISGGGTGVTPLRIPGVHALRAHPNPFNPSTSITFALGESGVVDITIYDVSGRRVRELFRGPLQPGPHSMTWDGRGDSGARVASGVYFVRVQQGQHRATTKVALVE